MSEITVESILVQQWFEMSDLDAFRKNLYILNNNSTTFDKKLFNLTTINRDGDPYWAEFMLPHFQEIDLGIKIVDLDKINLDKKWIISLDISYMEWRKHPGDLFESFDKKILDALNRGNAYLVLNHQCESFTNIFFHTLYQKLEQHPSIPHNKIIYMVAAADIEQVYNKFVEDYNIPPEHRIQVMYTHHVYKRFRYLENGIKEFDYDNTVPKERKFLSLNRLWHDHRLIMVSLMAERDLLKHGYVSLGVMEFQKEHAQDKIDHIYSVDYGLGREIANGYAKIKPNLPLQIDDIDLFQNQFSMNSLPVDFYQKSYFSLVSSTNGMLSQEQSVGFTEKEVKPIMYKHPFIIYNLPGALAHLKSMGFLTFEPWFDESYDKETNDYKRLDMILKEVKRLSELTFEQWNVIIKEMEPVLAHNYNRMINYTSEHCYFNSDLKKFLYYVS